MKNLTKVSVSLFAVALSLCVFTSCDEHEGDTDSTSTLERWQNESYETIINNIAGYWAGLEWTDDGTTWSDLISPWSYYTFRSDGTYTEENGSLTYDGKYVIYKNEGYFENQDSGDVYIDLNGDNGVSSTKYIHMISGKLYLHYLTLGHIDYTGMMRYTKQ